MGDAAETEIMIDDSPAVFGGEEQTAPAETPAAPDPEPEIQETDEEKREKAFAKLAWEKRKAEREAKELKDRLAKLEATQSQGLPPVVPDIPDPLSLTDEQHREYIRKRDEAVAAKASYDAQQQALMAQQQRAEQEAQERRLEAIRKQTESYTARAVQLGIKPEELREAGKAVGDFGIDDSLAEMILQDDQGPLITKYLYQNPMELAEISQMHPVHAAVYITAKVKPKAAALKPKVSAAPNPPTSVRSGGVVPRDYGPKGASFE